MRELVNFVNITGSYCICLVTKIKNSAENERNFNLQNKTNHHPAYVVHDVHIFTDWKIRKTGEIEADSLKNHDFLMILCELYVLWLTTLRASSKFAYPAMECFFGSVNFCELSIFEVHTK